MSALVLGAVNDVRTKILLDTRANVLAVSELFTRRLHLKRRTNSDRQIDVQGIGKGKVLTSSRAKVKVTLGWQVFYEFKVWIMPHHAGVDMILGTDFMIPAGIRLDLYNSTARLPEEVGIPLIKSHSAWPTGLTYGDRFSDGPAESAGDDPASSVQAVATSLELTDCDVAEPAAAAQTDAAEWDDGPNAGAAHQSRLGVTILEAKSPDQASEREHLSRVGSARHETAELKEALRTAKELIAELSADSEEGSSVREAIDSLLSDEIEVSDVALADDPEEDLRLR
ncbi:unnamed protein product [Phytophthora fragariaefolia]|uniref:Unnamed protein product n=1 Tax=Phytophthora fragariaefolia TaxID=1490495 RepID=A0A9W6Y5P8_9STRA|nr:unnamed protein product [Phytophthora fragariaefolia]